MAQDTPPVEKDATPAPAAKPAAWNLAPSDPEPVKESTLSPLVQQLTSENQAEFERGLQAAMTASDRAALAAVEQAIEIRTGKTGLEFYKPGGMRAGSPDEAVQEVLYLVRSGACYDDPVHLQSLIPGVAMRNDALMRQLKQTDTKALQLYQLLGIQMQLGMMIG